ADPDPYRNAVRAALAARLARQVLALVARPEALEQPPWFAAILGQLDLPPADRKRAVLESVLRARPGDLNLLMCLGGTDPFNQAEGAVERVRWFQAAVAARPENLAARTNLGISLLDSGNSEAAMTCFREVIRLDLNFALAHNNLGAALAAQGRLKEAEQAFRHAIRLKPDDAEAHSNLGAALNRQGRHREAEQACRDAIKRKPDYAEAHNN